MIEFQNVSKLYGDKEALSNLNLQIENGEIMGLIGHNGAGKSTTIKSLVSIISPSSGRILVDGQDLSENRLAIKRKIGYVADSPDLFLRLTANEFWELIASSYDLSSSDLEASLARLLNVFDFAENRYQVIETLSHGMRQKVFVIGALLSDLDIWVLDEPLTGLDPQAAFDLKQMMKEHAQKGKTVLFSTHVLEVAEQVCDRIAILKKGHLIYCGKVEDLRRDNPDQSLESIYLTLLVEKRRFQMRLKVIKKLVDINILYSSQEANLANLRKKQAKNTGKKVNVSARVLSSYIFSSLLMLIFFSTIAIHFPFEEMPVYFSFVVAILLVIAFSTSLTAFYNVFYESKDLASYRPYAFKESEIIIAKGLSVLLPALTGIVPILAYFLALYISLAPSLWLGLPLMLLSLTLLFVSVALVMVVAVHFLAQTTAFRKYQSIFSNVMIGIGVLIPLIFVFFLQSTFGSIVDKVRDIPFLLYPLHIFYKIAVEPFSTEALVGLLAWIGLTLFLLYLTKKKVLPRFYDVILLNSEEKVKKERRSKERISTTKKGFFRMVLRYHLTLLGQGTGVVTVLFTSAFLPYLMMIGLISKIRDSQIVPDIHPPYWLPLFFIALFIAVVNNNITSLHSIALSLERENVDFLKSLPFDFARYVKVKFWIIYAVQSFLPILTLLGLSLYLGLPIISMIYLIMAWILASVILSCHHYFKDVKNLSINWSSITDLVNRSNGIVAIVLLFIYSAILMALVIGSIFLVQSLSTILAISLGVGALILLLALAIFGYHYYLSRILAEIEKR